MQTVTVYSVVGTLYTDFKDGTVLFTVELRITDRPSPSLYRLCTVRAVLAPSKYRESLLHGVRQSSVHSGYQNGFRSCAIDLPHPKYEAIKIQLSKYNRQKYKKKNTTVSAVQNNRQSAVEVQIQTCCMNDPSTVFQFVDRRNCMFSAITVEPCGDWMQEI